MDPVEIIVTEIQAAELAISDICEAANNALSGFFMAVITSDPTWAKNLALSKFFLRKMYCKISTCAAHSKL